MLNSETDHRHLGSSAGSRQIAHVPIVDLKPHPRNARKHSAAQTKAIAKSIDTFGFNAPVLADKNGNILAGHGRVEAAKLLDLMHVPVVFLHHLSEEEARAYMLADNKLTDRSDWNDAALAIELKELSDLALGFDIDATGFELPEIDFRIQSTEDAETIDRADEFEFTPGPAATMPGDIWHLGEHRIICGSALDEKVVSQIFAGDKANATFTDSPYNVKIQGNAAGHGNKTYREFAMATGEMSEPEFTDFLAMALTNARSHSVPGALIYGCMDWRHIQEMLHAAHTADLHLVNLCVWVKPNGRLGSFYKSRHELVFVFKNGKEAHQNNIQLGRFGRNRTNVWNYSSPSPLRRRGALTETEAHPTVKPLLLVSDAILDCTRRNDVVFDPFLGSGTTLLAAERTGRRCFGIELDPLYVDTAVTRWQRMTGRKAHNHLGESFDILKSQRSMVDDPR
jgi:DNA modification methylase